jgi:hypothetical protein
VASVAPFNDRARRTWRLVVVRVDVDDGEAKGVGGSDEL